MMFRIALRLVLIAAVGLSGSCLAGCTMKITNTELGFKSLPEGAWAFKVESPQFAINSSFDAEKTGKEIVKGIKGIAEEIMGLPVFSLIGGMFEAPPVPTPDGG